MNKKVYNLLENPMFIDQPNRYKILVLDEIGLSHKEIGTMLGVSESWVYKVTHSRKRTEKKLLDKPMPRIEDVDKYKGTLCWRCRNAVPSKYTGYGCSWSMWFIPVEGWTAKAMKMERMSCGVSYLVKKCPKFEED